MSNVAILLAAGCSSRMNNVVEDKTLTLINNKPLVCFSIEAFIQSGVVDSYVVVYRDESQRKKLNALFSKYIIKTTFVQGGKIRQDSVKNALNALTGTTAKVFIHDCARPLITASTIQQLAQALEDHVAACVAHRITDTIKETMENGYLKEVDRDKLWAMETPQGFCFKTIYKCYEHLEQENMLVTDDTSAVLHLGYPVHLVENSSLNPKLTYPGDLALIEHLLRNSHNYVSF